MLLKLRDKVTGGKVAVVIVVLLAIPFAFFGIGNYFTASMDTNVARIQMPGKWYSVGPVGRESRDISEQAYRQRLDMARQNMRQALGENFDASMFEDPTVRRQILDQMIDEELLAIAAERDGLVVSNEQVAAEIRAMEVFHVDGEFNVERYRQVLSFQQPVMSPSQFDARVRSDLTRRVMPQEIGETAFATEADVDALLRLRDQRRDFSYLDIQAPELDPASFDEAGFEAWFERNRDRYRTDETVVIQYLELRGADIPLDIRLDEESVRNRFEENRSRWEREERRLTSHILLAVDPMAGEADWDATRERAEALLAEIQAGAAFDEIAREHSDDPESAGQGGDLDWLTPGAFGADFSEAVFAASEGEVAGPVRTVDGYHLVLVREVEEGEQVAFEDIRDEVEADMLQGERERVFSERAGRMMDIVYRDSSTLAPAAEALGLEIQQVGPFGRQGGDGIAAHPEVVSTAFASQMLSGNEVSGALELSDDHLVVIQVAEHSPSEPLPLSQVRDEAEAAYRDERLAEAAQAKADELLAALRGGESLEALAERAGGTVRRRDGVGRMGGGIDRALLETAFAMPRPADDESPVELARLGSRNFALVQLHAVQEGDASQVSEQERTLLRLQLGNARSNIEASAFIEALRRQYPVQVNESRL